MKHFPKKVCMILAAACVGAGLLIAGVGFAMADFDLYKLNKMEENIMSESYNLPGGLSVDLRDTSLTIKSGIGEQVLVEAENCQLEVTERTDGVLAVNRILPKQKWYEMIRFGPFERASVEITLPRNFTGGLEVKLGDGVLDMSDLDAISSLCVEQRDGKTELRNVRVNGSALLRQNDGRLTLDSVTADSLETHSRDGGLFLNKVAVAGRLTAESNDGGVNFADVTAANCDITGRDGRVSLADTRIDGDLHLTRKDGSVKLDRSTARLLSFDMRDGNVTGTLLGKESDYKVGVEIRDGSTNLTTSHTGDKEIRAKLQDGNIKLQFVD